MKIYVLLVLCAFAGCKSADGKPAREPEPVPATIESARAEACECADEACADRMIVELERQRQQFEAAYAEATSCVQKIKPPKDLGADVIRVMGEFKDKLCACKDQACAEHVHKEMMEWALANMETLKNTNPTEEQEAQARLIEDERDKCKVRLSPSTP